MEQIFQMDQFRARFNILVVDDEPEISEILKIILGRDGYTIHEASDPKEALETFKRNDIHLVLVDYKMPDINGVELSEKILKLNPNVPIVMISGVAEREIVLNAFRIGVTDIIDKPFNDAQISRTVRKYFSQYVTDNILEASEQTFTWELFEEELTKHLSLFNQMTERLTKSADALICDLLVEKMCLIKNRAMEIEGAEILFGLCHSMERLFMTIKEKKKKISNDQVATFTDAKSMILVWSKSLANHNSVEAKSMDEKLRSMLRKLGNIEIG